MTNDTIEQTVTISNAEIEGLGLMLNAGAAITNRALHEACRKAAELGETSVQFPPEFIEFQKGKKLAKGFIERIGL